MGLLVCLLFKKYLKILFKCFINNGLFHSAPNALLTAALIYSIINELTSEEESEESEDESDSEDEELLLYNNSCN